MSTIVKAELYYGAYRSVHLESNLQLVQGELVGGDADATAGSVHLKSNLQLVQEFLAPFATIPLDDHASEVYGHLRHELAQQGTLTDPKTCSSLRLS